MVSAPMRRQRAPAEVCSPHCGMQCRKVVMLPKAGRAGIPVFRPAACPRRSGRGRPGAVNVSLADRLRSRSAGLGVFPYPKSLGDGRPHALRFNQIKLQCNDLFDVCETAHATRSQPHVGTSDNPLAAPVKRGDFARGGFVDLFQLFQAGRDIAGVRFGIKFRSG